jgi:hypothetical protein
MPHGQWPDTARIPSPARTEPTTVHGHARTAHQTNAVPSDVRVHPHRTVVLVGWLVWFSLLLSLVRRGLTGDAGAERSGVCTSK